MFNSHLNAMHVLAKYLSVFAVSLMFQLSAYADLVVEVRDKTFVANSLAPTQITVPIQLSVAVGADASPGDPFASWDLELFDVGNLTGGITEVQVTGIEEGNAFDGFSSFFLSNLTLPSTLAGTLIAMPGAPSPVLVDGISLAVITMEVPAGQTGTFEVLLSGTSGLGDFGVFDENSVEYENVSLRNGTIHVTAIPEPSPILLLGLLTTGLGVLRRTSLRL